MTDLIQRWQAGDEEAFEALFEQYKNLVLKTAYLMSSDGQEAEDILQEVFIRAWNSRHTFDQDRGRFIAWINRITINLCISRGRRKGALPLSLEAMQDDGFDPVGKLASPEDISLEKLGYKRLTKAVNSLDGKHQPVLVLRYFNDLPYSEIAQVMGIPTGTVKSRLNEAVKSLRRELYEREGL